MSAALVTIVALSVGWAGDSSARDHDDDDANATFDEDGRTMRLRVGHDNDRLLIEVTSHEKRPGTVRLEVHVDGRPFVRVSSSTAPLNATTAVRFGSAFGGVRQEDFSAQADGIVFGQIDGRAVSPIALADDPFGPLTFAGVVPRAVEI